VGDFPSLAGNWRNIALILIDLQDRGFELSPVGVEKLLPPKFAKIKFRQDALQTTLSVFLDIFHPLPIPPNLGDFEENGLFQQRRARPVAGAKLERNSIP
jgi:hypothetical protein